jgi:hypothetical protein
MSYYRMVFSSKEPQRNCAEALPIKSAADMRYTVVDDKKSKCLFW